MISPSKNSRRGRWNFRVLRGNRKKSAIFSDFSDVWPIFGSIFENFAPQARIFLPACNFGGVHESNYKMNSKAKTQFVINNIFCLL